MYYILFAVLFLLMFMALEAGRLKCEYIKFSSELNIRAALISDIHTDLLMVSSKDAALAVKKNNPDFLIIAGDIIEKEKDIAFAAKWIKEAANGLPVFMVLGNHDHKCFKKNPRARDLFFFNLKSMGVEILVNRSVQFIKGDKSINITGIDDLKQGMPLNTLAFMQRDTNAAFNLTVSHNPDTVLTLSPDDTDLFLCGHFHGGQIWMPFNMEYYIFRNETTCRQGFRKGLHKINGVFAYISRGIGNVVVPFRLGSRPEITFIDL